MTRNTFLFNSLKLSYQDWNINSKKVILFAHANGYSVGCYEYYFRKLSEAGFRIIALDFAGHGESEGTLYFKDWLFYRDQLLELLTHLGLKDVIGIGHSMGGACMLMASNEKAVFRQVIAFDPVVLGVFKIVFSKLFGSKIAKNAMRRREKFSDKKTIQRIYRKFPAFRNWNGEIFQDYINSCFQKEGDEWKLRCSPKLEAKNFNSTSLRGYIRLGKTKTKSHIFIPENYGVCSPQDAKRIIKRNPESRLIKVEKGTHFFPFERPDWTLEQVLNLLAE